MTPPLIPMSEEQLQAAVLELAARLGWLCYHPRPALTNRGWCTAAQGNGAAGFPDCVLVHPQKRRLIFSELKAEGKPLSTTQVSWMLALCAVRDRDPIEDPIEVYRWSPSDWSDGTIERVLRGGV